MSVDAIVVGIHRGARNGKWGVYRYQTRSGSVITARDVLQMYFIRVGPGDAVTVLYDEEEPETVTADLGLWVWQAPVIFLCGFLLLSVLGMFIWRSASI